MSDRYATRLECDHCGGDLFAVYLSGRHVTIECDSCGCQLDQKVLS